MPCALFQPSVHGGRAVCTALFLSGLLSYPAAYAATVNTFGALDGDDGSPTPLGRMIFEVRHITGLSGGLTPQLLMGVTFGTVKRTELGLTWTISNTGPNFPAVWPWFKYAVWYEEDKERPCDLSLLAGAAFPGAGSTTPGSVGLMAVVGKRWDPLFLALNLGYGFNAPVLSQGKPGEHVFYGNLTFTYDFSEPWGVYGEAFAHTFTISPANGGANVGLMWRPKSGLSLDLTVGSIFASGMTTYNFGTGFTVTI